MTKNDHQGGPRIVKNAKKSTLENLKNQKMAPKKAFLRDSFFSKFWIATKLEKREARDAKETKIIIDPSSRILSFGARGLP